ncbi:MAG TPA: hypothetical protein VHO90_10555 [Bacteroidales bacterium]|nr:hypothetical protein [Bacteroidales bacterium]
MFVAGALGLFLILKNANKYFNAGKFYYNYKRIKKILSLRISGSQEKCFFSPRYVANSIPYKVNMVKIKNVELHNYGPGQHGVAFNQKSVNLKIPRSHHALVVHSVLIVFKLTVLTGCIFFLDISSMLWRIIIAVLLTLLLSKIILLITGTRSTVSYLVTTGLLLRMLIWFLVILIFSYIQLRPFNIYTSEYMYGITVFMLLFDSFLDQFLNFVSRKKFQKPLFRQHPLIEQHLEKKYQFGYDMPVLSVFYPVYKWFLG